MMDHPLDNQLWHALSSRQAEHAIGSGEVRLFRPEIAPAAGIARVNSENLSALAAMIPLGGTIILHSPEPLTPPPELEVVDTHPLLQMVANRLAPAEHSVEVQELTPADVPAMKELVDIAQPGPMLPGAFVLGRFVGIVTGGRLAAIAGDRLRPPGFGELCTVCSHPDFRGRGYARIVVSAIAEAIVARGDTPYLMVVPDNIAAVGLYTGLGFEPRRLLFFNALKRVA
jgi:ribosomal protein S18 acetylase RimI-like enzyme